MQSEVYVKAGGFSFFTYSDTICITAKLIASQADYTCAIPKVQNCSTMSSVHEQLTSGSLSELDAVYRVNRAGKHKGVFRDFRYHTRWTDLTEKKSECVQGDCNKKGTVGLLR